MSSQVQPKSAKIFSKSYWSGLKASKTDITLPIPSLIQSSGVPPNGGAAVDKERKDAQIDTIKATENQVGETPVSKQVADSTANSFASFTFSPGPPNTSQANSDAGSVDDASMNSAFSTSQKMELMNGSPIQNLAKTGPRYSLEELDFVQSKHADLKDFQLIKLVGKGGFAKVYQALRKADGKIFALKVMRKDVLKKLRQANHVMNEKNILKSMSACPFIAHIVSTFQDHVHLFMIQEFMAGGDLFSFIKSHGHLHDSHAQFYAAEIFLGLNFLHDHFIVFRDLKPENIMFDVHGHIRLADFGFSKEIKEGTTATFCGTPSYLAPEVLQKKPYGLEVDWWTYGVVIFQLCSGCSPFQESHPTKTFARILHCAIRWPPEPQLYFTNNAFDIITQLLEIDPVERLLPIEIKEHEWFENIKWDLMEKLLVDPPFKMNQIARMKERMGAQEDQSMTMELSSGDFVLSTEKLFHDF